MNYLKFLWTRKWAIVVVALVIMFLTVGLPSNTGWHSVKEIEDGKERFGAILLLVAIAAMSLLQVNNEFQRGKK
jgi:hypothetical protein